MTQKDMKIVKQKSTRNINQKSVSADEASDVDPAPKVHSKYVKFKLNEEKLTETIIDLYNKI